MDVEKMQITPGTDGKVLLGNHFHELKDESLLLYETDNLEAFMAFLVDKQNGCAIYYGESACILLPVAVTKNTQITAKCSLTESAELTLLKAHLGKELNVEDFEKFLTAMRRKVPGVLPILSQLRDMVVSKNVKYERQNDTRGNYKLHIERTASQGDWETPETLTFKIPVFKYLEETVEIVVDFSFDMKSEGSRPVFSIQNLNVPEILQDRKREIMETRLGKEGITCPKYWGSAGIKTLDDGWRFKENAVK